jgi:surface antigen
VTCCWWTRRSCRRPCGWPTAVRGAIGAADAGAASLTADGDRGAVLDRPDVAVTKGQCTSFVAWRLNNRNHIKCTNGYKGQHFGNAKSWDNAARAAGISVTSTPRVGDVAQSNAGSYGHVAVAAKVNASTVVVEEYNYAHPDHYGTRTVSKSAFNYIHFPAADASSPSYEGRSRHGGAAPCRHTRSWMIRAEQAPALARPNLVEPQRHPPGSGCRPEGPRWSRRSGGARCAPTPRAGGRWRRP